MKKSKTLLILALYFATTTLLDVGIHHNYARMSRPELFQEIVGLPVSIAMSVGLFLHRRWSMWLYYVYAPISLIIFSQQDMKLSNHPSGKFAVYGFLLLLTVVPAALIWIRRDRLSQTPSEAN